MQRKRQPNRNDEPEVTFELDSSRSSRSGGRRGAAGAVAAAGAGLVSGGAAPQTFDSLDVFDQTADPATPDSVTPVTSFHDLNDAASDPEFPPIDFGASDAVAVEAEDGVFGASSDIGGGFALDSLAGDEVYGASAGDLEPVPDHLTGDSEPSTEPDLDVDSTDHEDDGFS